MVFNMPSAIHMTGNARARRYAGDQNATQRLALYVSHQPEDQWSNGRESLIGGIPLRDVRFPVMLRFDKLRQWSISNPDIIHLSVCRQRFLAVGVGSPQIG